jgi:hypothetical protein
MITESQARFVLRRMGYRLSQYNHGYMIIDASHNYVGAEENGVHREMTLEQVADWIAAKSGTAQTHSGEPVEAAPEA